jgi:hypothetical protein
MAMCTPEKFGADPVNIQWRVVRGDSASLRVEFLDNDEVTYYDTSTWTYKSTSYDQSGDFLDELECVSGNGYVDIKATPEITKNWGTKFLSNVAELPFDLEVTIDVDTVWTPVIGTIYVLGDVTQGSL